MPIEDDPHLPDPTAPVALYEGPKLSLFRGWGLFGLVVVCVALGAGGREAALHLPDRMAEAAPVARRHVLLSAPGPVIRAQLPTPSGGLLSLPGGIPVLVNVWLQNCHDCMPAFEAWRAMVEANQLPEHMTVYNVAYGQADLAWARSYHLDDKLMLDGGEGVVRPLGISSFTTLVLDRHGRVRLRDRPDTPGYADRVAGALQALWSDADAVAPEPARPSSSR